MADEMADLVDLVAWIRSVAPETGAARRRCVPLLTRIHVVPFKLNQDRRHHILQQKHRVTNWREYDAALRQRGSLTVWFIEEAIAAWAAVPRTSRGGQPWYSPLRVTP
jgi:hypothetical protein